MQRHRHNVKVSKLLVGLRPYQAYTKRHPCVVLLSRTASPSPAVIAVTVKIQIGRMTVIGQGDGEEVVWRRFRDNEPHVQIQHLRKPH